MPQYYVEGNHEAIIDPSVFDMVQKQIAERNSEKNRVSCVSIFSGKIKCGDCGSWYGPKVWHSNDKYRRKVWRCNHKFDDSKKCSTPHLNEEIIKRLFVKAVNILFTEKNEIIANFRDINDMLFCNSDFEMGKRKNFEQFLSELDKQEGLLSEFNEDLWYSLVEFVTVFNKEKIIFTFKDGTEIRV